MARPKQAQQPAEQHPYGQSCPESVWRSVARLPIDLALVVRARFLEGRSWVQIARLADFPDAESAKAAYGLALVQIGAIADRADPPSVST